MSNQNELNLKDELNNGLKSHKNNNFQEVKKIYKNILIQNQFTNGKSIKNKLKKWFLL